MFDLLLVLILSQQLVSTGEEGGTVEGKQILGKTDCGSVWKKIRGTENVNTRSVIDTM